MLKLALPLAVAGLLCAPLTATASERKLPTTLPKTQDTPECSVCTRRHQAMARARKQLQARRKAVPSVPDQQEPKPKPGQ